MKHILFFLGLMVVGFSFAQTPKANFYTENGELFTVILDGRKINNTPANRVSNVPLEHDWAKAKIIFNNRDIPELTKTIQGTDADGRPSNVTWIIKQKKNGKWAMNAGAWTALEAEPAPVQTVVVQHEYIAPPPPPPTEVSHTMISTTTTTTTQDPNDVSISAHVNGIGVNINVNDVDANYSETHTTHSVTTTTSSTNVYQDEVYVQPPPPPNPLPGYNGPIGCDYPMNHQAFLEAKQSILDKDFEDTKLTMAKQITKMNCLLASQVKEIMSIFTFEDTKLEFAKFAYRYTYDIGNYYKVNDAFTYESSIDDLNSYLGL